MTRRETSRAAWRAGRALRIASRELVAAELVQLEARAPDRPVADAVVDDKMDQLDEMALAYARARGWTPPKSE